MDKKPYTVGIGSQYHRITHVQNFIRIF